MNKGKGEVKGGTALFSEKTATHRVSCQTSVDIFQTYIYRTDTYCPASDYYNHNSPISASKSAGWIWVEIVNFPSQHISHLCSIAQKVAPPRDHLWVLSLTSTHPLNHQVWLSFTLEIYSPQICPCFSVNIVTTSKSFISLNTTTFAPFNS